MKAIKIIRDADYGCWSVQVLHEESGRYYWLDVSYDEKYHELNIDWNQYIFYVFNDDDMERKAFQENCDNFDEASSEVYCTLISEGEVKETDINYGGVEIAIKNWEAKSWEIRQ